MNEHFESYTQYPHNPQYSGSRDNITDITDITDKDQKVKNMSEEEYRFEERSAIMEFDGGLSRDQAEALAKGNERSSLSGMQAGGITEGRCSDGQGGGSDLQRGQCVNQPVW